MLTYWCLTMVNDWEVSINDIISMIRKGESEEVEFKKTVTPDIGKDIVAMANTSGGFILVGVSDDGKIVGAPKDAEQRISDILISIIPSIRVKIHSKNIEEKKIVIIWVPRSPKIHTFRNIAYIRVGKNVRPLDLYELLSRASESILAYSDKMPTDALASEINFDLFKHYLELRKKVRGVGWYGDSMEIARRLNIVVKVNKREVLSLAGLLFFHEAPHEHIHWARLRFLRCSTDDLTTIVEDVFFEGPLWKIIDEITNYLRGRIAKIPVIVGKVRREDIYEYPLEAVREAITNALAHRNYLIATEVHVFLTPRRLIIRNPGSFPPGITPENPRHVPRNPLICQLLYDMGYIEKWGVGIIKMKKICSEHPLVRLKFDIQPYYTEVIFEKIAGTEELLDDIDKQILRIIGDLEEASSSEICQRVGLSKPSVVKRLKRLETLGLVRKLGRGARTRYKLT